MALRVARGLWSLLSGNEDGKDAAVERYIERLPSRFNHLALSTNIEFVLPQGGIGHAIDADTAIEICSAYSEADDADELRAISGQAELTAIGRQATAGAQ